METITTNIKKINVNGIIQVPIESFSKDGVSFSCGSISISNNNLINKNHILFFRLFLYSQNDEIEQQENKIIIPEENEMIRQHEMKTDLEIMYINNPRVVLIRVKNKDSFNGDLDFSIINKSIKHIRSKDNP